MIVLARFVVKSPGVGGEHEMPRRCPVEIVEVDGLRYFRVNNGALVAEHSFGYNAVTLIAEES